MKKYVTVLGVSLLLASPFSLCAGGFEKHWPPNTWTGHDIGVAYRTSIEVVAVIKNHTYASGFKGSWLPNTPYGFDSGVYHETSTEVILQNSTIKLR